MNNTSDYKCDTLLNPFTHTLYPNIINNISLNYDYVANFFDLEGKFVEHIVLEVKNKFVHKNWHIINKYIVPSPQTQTFIIPIVTETEFVLPQKAIIDAVQCKTVDDLVQIRKGKHLNCTNIKT